jgi:hypothetical protein
MTFSIEPLAVDVAAHSIIFFLKQMPGLTLLTCNLADWYTGVYFNSENDAEKFCDQFFQRHHGKGKGKDRQQDDHDELKDRISGERDRPDAPDYLETVSQIGERLYIATPDELLIRRCASADPFLIEPFDISARQLPVLAQADPLHTHQVRAKGKEWS